MIRSIATMGRMATRQVRIQPVQTLSLQTLQTLSFRPAYPFAKKGKKEEKKKNQVQEEEEEEGMQSVDLKSVENQMEKTVESFRSEMGKLKVGRLSSDMLEEITVKAYGEMTGLLELCQAVPRGPDTLILQIFDEGLLKDVTSAIENTNLDLRLSKEGRNLVCTLQGGNTREAKEMLVKTAKSMADSYKQRVRRDRTQGLDTLRKMQDRVPKDTYHRATQEVQEFHDKAIKALDTALKNKEAELLQQAPAEKKRKK